MRCNKSSSATKVASTELRYDVMLIRPRGRMQTSLAYDHLACWMTFIKIVSPMLSDFRHSTDEMGHMFFAGMNLFCDLLKRETYARIISSHAERLNYLSWWIPTEKKMSQALARNWMSIVGWYRLLALVTRCCPVPTWLQNGPWIVCSLRTVVSLRLWRISMTGGWEELHPTLPPMYIFKIQGKIHIFLISPDFVLHFLVVGHMMLLLVNAGYLRVWIAKYLASWSKFLCLVLGMRINLVFRFHLCVNADLEGHGDVVILRSCHLGRAVPSQLWLKCTFRGWVNTRQVWMWVCVCETLK